jgi:hypothetical protein
MKPSGNIRKPKQGERKRNKETNIPAHASKAKSLGTFQSLKSLFTASAHVNFGCP